MDQFGRSVIPVPLVSWGFPQTGTANARVKQFQANGLAGQPSARLCAVHFTCVI